MSLLERLREKDKQGLFEAIYSGETYLTKFLPFDYRNGYILNSIDENENLIKSQKALGIPGGCFMTVVGKSGTSKTTFVIQSTVEMIQGYENAFVIHYDLEQATTYTRIKNVTGAPQKFLKEQYILKQGQCYIQDIFATIMKIIATKEEMVDELMHDTGKLDEFGLPIRVYEPTIVIIDSIPSLSSKENSKDDEMQGGTYANRMAKDISQFYTRLMPVLKPYNITVVAINHLKAKIEINPMMKTQPQLLYMKMDESMPGGVAPVYYAHLLLKFVAVGSGKYVMEKDGFDGNDIMVIFLKSRTNKAGQSCTLVYNQVSGFSQALSLLKFAYEVGLVQGKNPHLYFTGSPDVKFNRNKFDIEFVTRPELQEAAMKACLPALEEQLSQSSKGAKDNLDIVELLERFESSQTVEDDVEKGES